MTLTDLIAEAWGAERVRWTLGPKDRDGQYGVLDLNNVCTFIGTSIDCERHLDALCAKAVMRALRDVDLDEDMGVVGARSMRDTMRWDNFAQRAKHCWKAMWTHAAEPADIGNQSGQWNPEEQP